MENQTKINIYTEEYKNKAFNTGLLSLSKNDSTLRVVNHHYENLFNYILKGNIVEFKELDFSNETLKQNLDENEKNGVSNGLNIFTSDDKTIQNEKLDKLLGNNEVYLTFGMLEYFDDDNILKKAPLILVPIKILKSTNGNFALKSKNFEVYLNNCLIFHLQKKHLDINYPVETNFSIIEYLTYVANKVSHHHFEVNNGVFITPLGVNDFCYYYEFYRNSNELSDLPIIKSISYLNNEFFNFNKPFTSKLKSRYLSLLDIDNAEYNFLKRINLRENMLFKTSSSYNKSHLFSNIVYDFLLNKKKVLITYNDDESYKQIKNYLKDCNLDKFTLDIHRESINKKNLVNKLIEGKLDYDVKLLDKTKIDETSDAFYRLKNDYKRIINTLRRPNEPLKLSINKAIWEYYNLRSFPLLNVEIPNASSINEDKLKDYLTCINSYASSINNLGCLYKNHPFYGFNKINLTQVDYINLKEDFVKLSSFSLKSIKVFKALTKYHIPEANTLKEMKCVLNIISLIPSLYNINLNIFNITDFDDTLLRLNTYNQSVESLSTQRSKLISLYDDRVFLIDYKELKDDIYNSSLDRKKLKNYSSFFNKNVKIDENILSQVLKELELYYSSEAENKANKNKLSLFKRYFKEDQFDTHTIEDIFEKVKEFNKNTSYLKKQGKVFIYQDLKQLDSNIIDDLQEDRKKAQVIFNSILRLVESIQNNFDESIVNLTDKDLHNLRLFANKAESNFASINQYLDFYLTRKKLNKTIDGIGEALLEFSTEDFVQIFIRRFYYDYANNLLSSNQLINDISENNYNLTISQYEKYDETRKVTIDSFICSNITNLLKENSSKISTSDLPYLKSIEFNKLLALPLNKLLSKASNLANILFPIHLINIKDVCEVLNDSSFKYDLNIIFPDENLLTKQSLPSLSRCNQIVVFDYLDDDGDDNYLIESEKFINAIQKSISKEVFSSLSYDTISLEPNNIDNSLKEYLIEKLKENGFIVSKNISTKYGIIDIEVRSKNTSRPTAISIDRLNYYSMESAIKSMNYAKEKLSNLSYAPYKILLPSFFINEKKEYQKLVNFIISNTVDQKITKTVTKTKPLIEYLFKEYVDPNNSYLSIENKNTKDNETIMLELLKMVAPVKEEEIDSVFKGNSYPSLNKLKENNIITIKNGFVFVNDYPITFKTSKTIRPLENISNEEIVSGIKAILLHTNLNEDTLIKYIMKSIGYSSMKQSQYFRLQNIVSELLETEEISYKDNLLFIQNK